MGRIQKIPENLKYQFFENVQDFQFGIYSVILWMNLGQGVYPLAKIAADFNSATFNSILQNFGEHKFVNFSLKFVD
jgi:hypothetical protein